MSDASSASELGSGGARLVGVGVGPGDPELLTFKAARLIQAADVVFAPVRQPGGRSLALEIVGALVDRARQEVVTLPFPSRRAGESWDAAARAVVERLGGARRGVFLTEGDPLLFGSFGHVVEALRRLAPGLPVEIVPGVSSVTAAAAAAGVPLADLGERLAIVPAPVPEADLARIAGEFACLVLLKVGPVLAELLDALDRLALLDSAVYVRRCGQAGQQIVTALQSLRADPPSDYFALIMVWPGGRHLGGS